MTLPDNQTMQTTYSGNSVTEIDQVNRKMQRLTDGLGRLVTVNEQDSSGLLTQATNYTYDLLGNLTQVNQGNQLRSYKYDALSRRIAEKIPEQGDPTQANQWTTTFTYTDFNALATRTDARGVITTNTYDTLNRATQLSYNTVSGVTTASTVTYNYDSYNGTTANGKLIRVGIGSDYEERYTFDDNFRIESAVRTIGTRSYTTGYTYNAGDQLTEMTYPSGQLLYFRHDSHGMTNSLGNYPSGGSGTDYVTGHTHDIAGQLSGITYGNGVTEQYGYDPARMQLTSHKAGTTSPYTNRMDLIYTYSASAGQMGVGSTVGNAGQLVGITGTINGTTESAAYTYDNYSRLVTSNQTSNGSSAQRRFAYDRWGNRTGVWDATNGGTQIQSVSNQTVSFPGTGSAATNRISSVTSGSTANYTYDANGNVTSDGVHTYGYDSENRVASVDSGATASYAYDHQNRRYKTTVGSTLTHYVWQGDKVLAEHNGSTGTVIINYIYSGSRMILSGPYYLLSDRLSTRLELNISGTVKGRQGHLPFGEDFAETGPQQEKHHFTSYERDSQTGTDYAMNRTYSFGVGRFHSADPFQPSNDEAAPQSWNRYGYVTNAPLDSIDSLGLSKEEGGDPDSCSGDVPPVEPPSGCDVTLGFKVVKVSKSSADLPGIPTAYHTYILLQAAPGLPRYYIRGGPTHDIPIPSWGPIVVSSGVYGPGTPDWPKKKDGPHKRLPLDHFKKSCAQYIAIMEINKARINASKIDYMPGGPSNSNAVAYTMLVTAGLKFDQRKIDQKLGPKSWLPGWGNLL